MLVPAAHAQLISPPAIAATLVHSRVMQQPHPPPATQPLVSALHSLFLQPDSPSLRLALSAGGVRQGMAVHAAAAPVPVHPSFPQLLHSAAHSPFSVVLNARPTLMERFTAPQLQYPRPALPHMFAATPPPRQLQLGSSAITMDAYNQRYGHLTGNNAHTAPARKAAQPLHQVPRTVGGRCREVIHCMNNQTEAHLAAGAGIQPVVLVVTRQRGAPHARSTRRGVRSDARRRRVVRRGGHTAHGALALQHHPHHAHRAQPRQVHGRGAS